MDLRFTDEEEHFRDEVRTWLAENLADGFEALRGKGGPGDEHSAFEDRLAWERRLAKGRWIGLGWPEAYGGRNASILKQVIFNEEYARARAPGRLSHIGEHLLGPTLIHFGTEAQKQRFLPSIVAAEELWCQGYSEPNAGSDLANVQTRAELQGDEWVVDGQKVWTSGAHWSDWCFVVCRTDRTAARHKGLSYLLVPMRQPGVRIVPIEQMTGTSEFSEVFFDGARAPADHIVGEVNGGWKVAMGTLAFERGVSTLGQQLGFESELREVTELAKANGSLDEPSIRQRIADAWIGLKIMRFNALRVLSRMEGHELGREAMMTKLYWATWHRNLGKLAMDVLGAEAEIAENLKELTPLQRLFLFARSDTIYAGSNQIQRNIIGERALGLPPEPKR